MPEDIEEILQDPVFVNAPRDSDKGPSKRKYLEYAFPEFKNKFPAEQDKYLNYIENRIHGKIKPGPTNLEQVAQKAQELGELGLEIGGMGLGASAGTAVGGPVGTIPGGGLGYAAARSAISGVRQLLGQEQPKTLPEMGKEFAGEIIPGMVYTGAGEIATKGIQKVLKPWEINPIEQQALMLAQREGISIPSPEVTGERSQAILWTTLNKLLGSVKPLQKWSTEQVKAYADWGERLFQNMGVMPKTEGGRLFKDAWERARGVFDQHTDYLKKYWKSLVPRVAPTTDNVNNWWWSLQHSSEWEALTTEKIKRGIRTVELSPEAKELQGYIKRIQKASDFSALDEIETRIGAKFEAGQIGDKTEGLYKQLYKNLRKDMRDFADSQGGSFGRAYNDYLTFYAENVGKFKGTKSTGKFLTQTDFNPEKVFPRINGNLQRLQEAKDTLTAEEFQIIRKMQIEDLINNSMSELNTNQGRIKVVDPTKLKKYMENPRRSDEYWNTLLNPSQKAALDEYRFIGERIPMAIELSGMPPKGVTAALLAGSVLTGGFGGGIAGGWDPKKMAIGATVGLGTMILVPRLVTKFVTSPLGLKWMTTGIDVDPIYVKTIARGGTLTLKEWLNPKKEQAKVINE